MLMGNIQTMPSKTPTLTSDNSVAPGTLQPARPVLDLRATPWAYSLHSTPPAGISATSHCHPFRMNPNSGSSFPPLQDLLPPLMPDSESATSATRSQPRRRATPRRCRCRSPYRSWQHRSAPSPPRSEAANRLSPFLSPNLPRARVSGLASSVVRRTGTVSVLTCPRRRLSHAPCPGALGRNTCP